VICRSPVVHPGDVQVGSFFQCCVHPSLNTELQIVTAVVPPEGSPLDKEKLSNCVVMSAKGTSRLLSPNVSTETTVFQEHVRSHPASAAAIWSFVSIYLMIPLLKPLQDGDLFHISEYKPFVDGLEAVHRPAEYAAGDKFKLDRDCDIKDVADFVTEYINSDVLGLVSTTHLIIADQNLKGIACSKCMTLAKLHSDAVDYAKTVSISRKLHPN